ncbi:MAG: HIT family hydrolase [Planctomycetes bacterium GWF2_41_51]|nr:MAG: HIT family hydrolase [Planctomycetes bacterium GWF2_41_51]HBG27743.1 HIT family protein [Phycisphaerales bacterium]
MDCIFCKIAAGQIPCEKIYEDENVLAFLDIGPLSEGHTLVIPKQHFTKIHECPAQLLAQIGSVLPKVAGAVFKGMTSDGYNVLCNNGKAAGQLVEHIHFHIIPRIAGDGVFTQWPAKKYQPGKVEKISEKIRAKL